MVIAIRWLSRVDFLITNVLVSNKVHYSVLLHESIELLAIKPNGIYVDGTLGRCGHTREILNKLDENGKLIAFDRDVDAVDYARTNLLDRRLIVIHDNFANIDLHLQKLGVEKIDGIILDLGVSSPQLDNAERGFSFSKDAALDMRMDNTKGESARDWINYALEADIADVLWKYGEEKFSRRIAANIVKTRLEKSIETTAELANIIAKSIPKPKNYEKHPATRSFQAIRIFINNELGSLEDLLNKLPTVLAVNARVVIISFHSLEDRIVKTYFNSLVAKNKLPKWVMQIEEAADYKVIAKKVKASINEINENTRSRSAVMRSLERLR